MPTETKMRKRIDSYDPNPPIPKNGTRWVWEIDVPAARELIEVTEVFWNGEEWWVRTRSLLGHQHLISAWGGGEHLNDLSRFWEAVVPVGSSIGRLSEIGQPARMSVAE